VGRRSKVVLLADEGTTRVILSAGAIADVLDSFPDVGIIENARANRFGLRNTFGQPKVRSELSED
jgi:hypothetical protein